MTTKSKKAKGRRLQKIICETIAKKLGISYNQQDDNCLIHSREMSQNGVDIILRGEAFEKFPFLIECKNQERLNLNEAIKQSKDRGENWLLIYKNNKLKNPIVILDFQIFLSKIIQEILK
jgi:hypothetical protein